MSEQEDLILYKVVVNHEEQYSIWPADKTNALGWNDEGFRGLKPEVLAYIKEHWTDMRPRSLRLQMDSILQPASPSPDALQNTTSTGDSAKEPDVMKTNNAPDATDMTPDAVPVATAVNADVSNNTGGASIDAVNVASTPTHESHQKRGWFFGRRRTN